jgi:hypothetical protein
VRQIHITADIGEHPNEWDNSVKPFNLAFWRDGELELDCLLSKPMMKDCDIACIILSLSQFAEELVENNW